MQTDMDKNTQIEILKKLDQFLRANEFSHCATTPHLPEIFVSDSPPILWMYSKFISADGALIISFLDLANVCVYGSASECFGAVEAVRCRWVVGDVVNGQKCYINSEHLYSVTELDHSNSVIREWIAASTKLVRMLDDAK